METLIDKIASCDLEQKLFESVYAKTPEYIRNKPVIDVSDPNESVFILKREHLYKYDADKNPEGLGLEEWFGNYEKEAMVSTAGIRGPQNILYPWDTRFPINMVGMLLSTAAKAMVAREMYPNSDLHKIAAHEVRYNSDKYLEIITRTQAAYGITTHIPTERVTIPIWMASFLTFKLDLLGGEYITASHGISVKTATKDLNDQGSQYLPEESMRFVNKIRQIFDEVRKNGSYEIKISSKDNVLICESLMKELNNGVELYTEYLSNGVATKSNVELIKNAKNKIIIENVGGCACKTLSKILAKLGIANSFEWFNTEEDPFFHKIGKSDVDMSGKQGFYDYSVDPSLLIKDSMGNTKFPVLETCGYEEKLAQKPEGTVILITDPDHDRMSIAQIENISRIAKLKELGIDYMQLNDSRILTVYTPNQGFLMIMDFYAKQLKTENKWANHPRFMIKTTASSMAWEEWGKCNGVSVVNVPVGFKEIASVMKKAEKQIAQNPDSPVFVNDIYGNKINLGANPRLIFGGEESGGMIIGPENLIKSRNGRLAIAMREKSASEAIFIASALMAHLENNGELLSDNLEKLFKTNNITGKFDVREDISYYNESEPDIERLKLAKKAGEELRTKNDLFYLSIAMAKRDGLIGLTQIVEIFGEVFPDLDFSGLLDTKFVGDGTYLEFADKFIEIRPSGTDAKTKAYGAGKDKDDCLKFARTLGNYSGTLTPKHKQYIASQYYDAVKEHSMAVYAEWSNEE